MPSLADAPAEAIDGRTLRFLLQKTLERKRKEEEQRKQEEKHEAKMKLLNDKVRHDVPLTEAEWAAWDGHRALLVLCWEKEEEEEEEASSQVLFITLCPHLVFWTVFYEPLAFLSMLCVYVPCGYLLIRQSWRRFGRFHRCLGCPGSTGNAISWKMVSRTRFCMQRNAWSLVHVMRQSTEFFVYVGTEPEVDSPALAGVFNAPDPFFHGPLYLAATGSVFGGGVQDHIHRFLVRQRIHVRRQSTLCSKSSFMAQTVPKTVELHRCSSWTR